MPAPGDLQIKDRRSWKTWQLVLGMLVAALVGMALDYYTFGGTPQSSSASNAPAYKLPSSTGPATGSSGSTTTTAPGGSTTTTAAGRSHDDGGWRIDHHDCPRWIHHAVDLIVVDGGGRTRTDPHGPDTDAGELDQPGFHHHRRRVEHRLGIQLHPGASRGAVVPGLRNARWVIPHWDACDQPDRSVRTIGHGAVQPRSANVGRPSPGKLHMGGQGHRLVASQTRIRDLGDHRRG